jgi:Rod binding domain-containing protein
VTIDTQTGTQTSAIDAQADRLVQHTRQTAASATPGEQNDAKIIKAGKDFESILLGTWLQQAENTFAKAPGGDDDDDKDAGTDQFQGIAMQSLASSLTASGGIGIAKMITKHLREAADSASVHAGSSPTPIKSLAPRSATPR